VSRRSTDELLEEALAHLEIAAAYASGDLDQQMVLDACSLRLAAGIETLSRLDVDVRAEIFPDEWDVMWGMRNRIAHGYLLVDPRIVRQTLSVDLPDLVERLRAARQQGDGSQ
jgi:uncharacterized protein with HEPN domain